MAISKSIWLFCATVARFLQPFTLYVIDRLPIHQYGSHHQLGSQFSQHTYCHNGQKAIEKLAKDIFKEA